MNNQKYTLENPPSLEEAGFTIEQQFLRHIKTGEIPNLKQYLQRLNHYDWTGLLANNPRIEFIKLLSEEMVKQIDWKYVLAYLLNYSLIEIRQG